ncbi:hypothetical protein [Ekhidna sp. To15]|uniref:hypothetical protein n=1 Tax=Ekhidna sp. To15 TaxID=3395267 RepID=UPI003F52542F
MNNTSKAENRFFQATSIWYLLTVFWGFAPSFYLLKLVEEAEPLPVHLVIHGVVFTIWISLYVVQVFLIRSKNYKLHKSLGLFGLFVMILMIPTGLFPVIYKYYSGFSSIDGVGHNVFRLSFGYLFFALAFRYRKQSFIHKRLMLGCMVMLMSAAIFRISFDLGMENSQIFNKGLQILPPVALFVFDLAKHRKMVLIDLLSVAAVFGTYFLADYFWLSDLGEGIMDVLMMIFVHPFV